MAAKNLRGVIVGASSLLGRELAEELNQSPAVAWELTLVDAIARDDAEIEGDRSDGADVDELEIRPLGADSFAGADVVFFAGDEATTRGYWKVAHKAGASVVDLAGALEGLPGGQLRCGWTRGGATPDLATVAISVAHPAAMMLAIAAERLRPLGLRSMAATVMEPASQQGSAGVDEMHRQTVALLSFKPLVQEVFHAQVAFNLRVAVGDAASVDLAEAAARIEREAIQLARRDSLEAIAVQLLQTPVFHGSAASVFVEFAAGVEESAVRAALKGDGMRVAGSHEDAPSNESVVGKHEIVVWVRRARGSQELEATVGVPSMP